MKICPNCGKASFYCAKGTVDTDVSVDFKDGKFVITPNENNSFVDRFAIRCNSCNETFDLLAEDTKSQFEHQNKQCAICGRTFSEEELDENGECIICRLKKVEPSFENIENAYDFNAVRMIAMLRIDNMKLSNANEKLEKDLEKAKEVQDKIDEANSKPKRGRKKKTETVEESTDDTEDTSTDVDTIDIDVEEDNTDPDIEISDDVAPELPDSVSDISNAMNLPED